MTENVRAGLASVLLFIAMTSGGICPLPLHTANTSPTQVPRPVLPGRGSRGILKSMTAEKEGAFSSKAAPWPVVNTSTQVESSENVHSQGRGCSERGRHNPPGSSGEHTFKRLKLITMVPSGFPIVSWHGGEAKLSRQRVNEERQGY